MSNTLIIDSLNTLFSMSNTAVLGAQEQFVAFMNPAAQELFRGDRTNHKLSELLPAHITQAAATEFVTSATIEKRHVIISVTSFGAFRLFSLVPQDENVLRAGAQFAPFLASLNAFRALTTYFSDYAMQLSDVRFRRNAAELTQFYYRLLRFTLNASTASGLSDGTLAFIPQLCDLGKECRALLDNIQPITDANGKLVGILTNRDLRFETNYFGFRGGRHTSQYENFRINNVKAGCSDHYAIFIDGYEEKPIKNIEIEHFHVQKAPHPYYLRCVENICLKDKTYRNIRKNKKNV